MNVLEALPPAWTADDQAAQNIRQIERHARREEQRASDMTYLTTVAATTFLEGGIVALLFAVEKVALPLILLSAASSFLLIPGILGCISLVSNSDHPIQDIFFSIGRGALIATCIGLLGLTILKIIPT